MILRQGTELRARCAMEFKNPATGRMNRIREGEIFIVTTSMTAKLMLMDRKKTAHIGIGFHISNWQEHFEVV